MSEDKGCRTCKYNNTHIDDWPCNRCDEHAENTGEQYTRWEPRTPPPARRCGTCRHYTLKYNQEPCQTCLSGREFFTKWEPSMLTLNTPPVFTNENTQSAPAQQARFSPYPSLKYESVLLPAIFEEIKKLAQSKGGEYAHGDDRLDNFRRNGLDVGLPMETIWRVYAGKHWDAITTYIKDQQTGHHRTRSESIRGRALDLMVYLTLFIAMLDEKGE